jgi:hypothetical protein
MPKTTILCWRTTLTTKSGSVTVEDYERWRDEKEEGKVKLATLIKERLRERYIDPVEGMRLEQKNGFAIMALSCLLIETLESFYRGWPKSPNSNLAFCGFFDRHANLLPEFKGHAQSFYANVRCGILHQGETTQGWTITRQAGASLFEPASLVIHATKFNRILGTAIDQYSKALETTSLSDDLWKNFVKKMNATVKACG